eukprot:1202566-Prorocentrum_lima.AAC.1
MKPPGVALEADATDQSTAGSIKHTIPCASRGRRRDGTTSSTTRSSSRRSCNLLRTRCRRARPRRGTRT